MPTAPGRRVSSRQPHSRLSKAISSSWTTAARLTRLSYRRNRTSSPPRTVVGNTCARSGHSRDAGAQRLEPFYQSSVAAFDRFERRQPALPVGGKAGGDQCHPGAQVAAVQRAATQLSRAADDDAVRITEEEIAAHAAQLLEREQAQLVQPVVHEGLALGLRRQQRDKADEIAGKPRPQAGGKA